MSFSVVLRLLLGVCVGVHAAAIDYSLPTDCSVAGWPVPKPPGGAKLLQVQAIIRSAVTIRIKNSLTIMIAKGCINNVYK